MPLKPIALNEGPEKKIYLLKPRGFCAGVVRAIDVVKIALDLYGPPVYVRKEIVHNNTIILIGHKDHDEVTRTLGEAPEKTILVESVEDVDTLNLANPEKVAYLTQTTLSLDETTHIVARLQERFPNIKGPKSQDICYATENRQVAVKNVAHEADLVLVVGSKNSSNSNRLVEVSKNLAPEHLVDELVDALKSKGFTSLEEVELIEEDVRFSLPGELLHASSLRPAAPVAASIQ